MGTVESLKNLHKELQQKQKGEEFREFVVSLIEIRNKLPYKETYELLETVLAKSIELEDKHSQVVMYYHIIGQRMGIAGYTSQDMELIKEMKQLSQEFFFPEGEALAFICEWMVEKLRENTQKAINARDKAIQILEQIEQPQEPSKEPNRKLTILTITIIALTIIALLALIILRGFI